MFATLLVSGPKCEALLLRGYLSNVFVCIVYTSVRSNKGLWLIKNALKTPHPHRICSNLHSSFLSPLHTHFNSQNIPKSGHTLTGWAGCTPKIGHEKWTSGSRALINKAAAEGIMEPVDKIDSNEWPGTNGIHLQIKISELWYTATHSKVPC